MGFTVSLFGKPVFLIALFLQSYSVAQKCIAPASFVGRESQQPDWFYPSLSLAPFVPEFSHLHAAAVRRSAAFPSHATLPAARLTINELI